MPAAPRKTPLRIEIAELETFIAVAELGSFSAAAQHLHLTQPSVTSRVQRLESALGAKLLTRTTRKVETTPDGDRLLAEANRALDGLRAVVDGFRERAKISRQRVVVAATPTLAAAVMPALVRDYGKRFTDVQVQLLDLRYPDLLAALDNGTADFGVLAYEGDNERLTVEPLRSEDMVLVVPPDHALSKREKVTLRDLDRQELMVIEQYQAVRQQLVDAMQRKGFTLLPSPSVGNLSTLLGMLDARMGMALLSRSMAGRRKSAGHAVVEFEGVVLRRNYALVYPARKELGTAAQSFRRFVRDHLTGEDPSYWSAI
jgi:LysR family transcriptional regulator, carnitine catabolism transcriptional activator